MGLDSGNQGRPRRVIIMIQTETVLNIQITAELERFSVSKSLAVQERDMQESEISSRLLLRTLFHVEK